MENTVSTKVSSGIISLGYNQEQVATIKETVAKGATDTELYMFLSLAKKYELDPFAKEIWFIKDNSGRVMIQAGRDGFLKTAQRDEKFKGIASFPVYSNDDFELNPINGDVKHKPNFHDRGELIGAWARVEKEGVTPYVSFADFKEYYAGYLDASGKVKTGKFGPMKPQLWDMKPAMMIQKVAQTIALRMTFGINGMYAPEEIDEQVENNDIQGESKKPAAPKKPITSKTKTEAIVAEAVDVVEEAKEEIEMITDAQVAMIHTVWSDIASIKEWDTETSEKNYRDNILKVTKKTSSKLLSKTIASQYIEYLSKNLDTVAAAKDKEEAAKKASIEPTATSGLMDIDQIENFINS